MTPAELAAAHAPQAADSPKTLRGGVIPHRLTAEDRRKGGLVTAEKRRQAARSVLEVAAEKVVEKADMLVGSYLKAAEDGDWRAADALIANVHGKPGQRGDPSAGQELEPGDTQEVRRMLIEHITVTKSDTPTA